MSMADENEDGRTTPASIRKEKMQAYPSPKKGQGITCSVRLLDGTDYEAQIDKRAKGQQVSYTCYVYTSRVRSFDVFPNDAVATAPSYGFQTSGASEYYGVCLWSRSCRTAQRL